MVDLHPPVLQPLLDKSSHQHLTAPKSLPSENKNSSSTPLAPWQPEFLSFLPWVAPVHSPSPHSAPGAGFSPTLCLQQPV